MKTSFLNELTEYNIASRSYEDVLMLLYYSQLGQIPRNDKREDFQWNFTGQHVLVQLPVQRRVRSQNQPLENFKPHTCIFLTTQKIICEFGEYDIQELQRFDVAKRRRNRATQGIVLKFQFQKVN